MTPIDANDLPAFWGYLGQRQGLKKLEPANGIPMLRFDSPLGVGGVLRSRIDPSRVWLLGAAGDYWERFTKSNGGR